MLHIFKTVTIIIITWTTINYFLLLLTTKLCCSNHSFHHISLPFSHIMPPTNSATLYLKKKKKRIKTKTAIKDVLNVVDWRCYDPFLFHFNISVIKRMRSQSQYCLNSSGYDFLWLHYHQLIPKTLKVLTPDPLVIQGPTIK